MKLNIYSSKAKMKLCSLVLAGSLFMTGLTGCSPSSRTNVVKGNETYIMSSLHVLTNDDNEYYICKNGVYKTIQESTYGYRYGFGFKDGKYQYGYTYGQMEKDKHFYEYIDIDTKDVIGNDEDMNGFIRTGLSNFYTTEEITAMNGEIEYTEVIERVEEAVNASQYQKR